MFVLFYATIYYYLWRFTITIYQTVLKTNIHDTDTTICGQKRFKNVWGESYIFKQQKVDYRVKDSNQEYIIYH